MHSASINDKDQPAIAYFTYAISNERGKMAYRIWSRQNGGSKKPTLICAHGLNQNSRHLELLARRLSEDFDVLVPDYPGRGLSDELADKLSYSYLLYVPLFNAFIQALGQQEVYWLGTSMGGLTGLLLASLPDTPIRKLVLNDIGPVIPKSTMQLTALAADTANIRFSSIADATEKMAPMLTSCGITDSAMKEVYVRASLRQEKDGSWRPDTDPGIYHYTKAMPEVNSVDVPFWQYWKNVYCPVLVLHGEHSRTLTPEIIAEMKVARPDIAVVDIPNTGHAPHLMDEAQAELVRTWLLQHSPL